MIRPWPKRFQHPHEDLANEPEADKALRMLRGLRHWLTLKDGVTRIEVDGQPLFIIKYNKGKHPNADPTAQAGL